MPETKATAAQAPRAELSKEERDLLQWYRAADARGKERIAFTARYEAMGETARQTRKRFTCVE